jgi:hypothetical protein
MNGEVQIEQTIYVLVNIARQLNILHWTFFFCNSDHYLTAAGTKSRLLAAAAATAILPLTTAVRIG